MGLLFYIRDLLVVICVLVSNKEAICCDGCMANVMMHLVMEIFRLRCGHFAKLDGHFAGN